LAKQLVWAQRAGKRWADQRSDFDWWRAAAIEPLTLVTPAAGGSIATNLKWSFAPSRVASAAAS